MKIVDIKTKIIPSNPRSKNYPIGYPGGIASNSNGVTPDLSIYLLKEIWERNFEERTDEYGNEYLYIRKPLAIGGGLQCMHLMVLLFLQYLTGFL